MKAMLLAAGVLVAGAAIAVGAQAPQTRSGDLFDRADANKDGSVTREEMRSIQGPRGARPFGPGRRGGPIGGPLLRVIDHDGNGALSGEEIAGASEALKALDANRDGQLTPEELRPRPGRGR